MAKGVYDALRRADEERRRKTGAPSASSEPAVMALDWESQDTVAVPVPGAVPFWRRWFTRGPAVAVDTGNEINKRRIALLQPESFVTEQFRMLRGRLDSLASQRPLRTISIASANPGEGKSTAAVNLAVVSAMGVDQQVLLIDCDLRRPRVHRSLGLEPTSGLAEILLGEASFEEARMKVENLSLDVLAVKGLPPNPSELLASDQMRHLIAEVGARYDRVILDTPAALGLPDAKIISELSDGLVMVVRADKTPKDDARIALEVLDRRRVLGMVINGVDNSRERYGYY